MKLFNDQIIFSNKILSKVAGGVVRLACQLATGGGKTYIFCHLAQKFLQQYPNESVLIFVHREELLDQTRSTLYDIGINAMPIVAGMKYIPPSPVYVGMIESAFKRLHKVSKIGLVIVDEAHIGVFNKLQDKFPGVIVLGFSATPYTANREAPMKMFYDDIVCGPSIGELIKMKRLCQNITYAPKEVVDRSELKAAGNDFDETIMGKAFSKVKNVNNTVSAYKRWGDGVKTVVFNVNTAHNQVVYEAFKAAGVNARILDSVNTPKEDRKGIKKWFKETPGAVLCNVGIATTGFDEPSVELIIVNRATMSMPLWIQMTGRGSRIVPGLKNLFTIIDMGGNALTHGDWCQERDWVEIFNNPIKPGKGGVAPFKTCIACEAVIYAGAKVCPLCGKEQPTARVPIEVQMSEFVVVTKNIDVEGLIKANLNRKQYYAFFQIANHIAAAAVKSAPDITDEIATFTLESYIAVLKEWRRHAGKTQLSAFDKGLAKKTLFKELKKLSPNWKTELIKNDNDNNQSL